jgi:hypothetical protein
MAILTTLILSVSGVAPVAERIQMLRVALEELGLELGSTGTPSRRR